MNALVGSEGRVFKLASVLLGYPAPVLFEGTGILRDHIADLSPKAARTSLGRFVDWMEQTDATQAAQHYVATFDLPRKKRSRCALYLTYFRHGDTRKRGMAMVEFKGAYRGAGFEPPDDELPDYLPMVLEFASISERGGRLLRAHRADLELLERALERAQTPYQHVLAAVNAQLPRLGRRELVQVRKAWEAGPPREEVGLEPFAPPEYMSGVSR